MTERVSQPETQAEEQLEEREAWRLEEREAWRLEEREAWRKVEQDFVLRVRQELDRSCAALDGVTQSRLNAMRHAVLAQGSRKRAILPAWIPLGGLATACVLVLAVLLQPMVQPGVAVPAGAASIQDLDLLTAAEELDFYEEYEFYQWLATSDVSPR